MTPLIPVILATLNLGLWASVLVVAVMDWRRYHDERAARGVLLGLVLFAAAVGSLGSAIGYHQAQQGLDTTAWAWTASIARGAMLAGGAAYLADLWLRRRDKR